MADDHELNYMVRLKPYWIGEMQNSKFHKVLLLEETQGSRKFPILIPMSLEGRFIEGFKRAIARQWVDNDVIDLFMAATSTFIRRIFILKGAEGEVKADVYAVNTLGECFVFSAPILPAVYHAATRGLHIYVDSELLTEVSKRIEIHVAGDKGQEDPDSTSQAPIIKLINEGGTPEDVELLDIVSTLTETDNETLTQALDRAVSLEKYEWAQLLSDEQARRDGKEEGEEE